MMSSDTRAFQGFQSSLEPFTLEKRVSTHRMVPPKPDSFSSWPRNRTENNQFAVTIVEKNCETNGDGENSTGFSFLQAPTNNSHNYKESNNDSEHVYVHPLDKRSSFPMSPKSLAMCTESLGSETGSDIDSSWDEFSYLLLKTQNCARKNQPTKKLCKKIEFPPPLSSISGEKGVTMQSHREGGRLVIKAFAFSSFRSYIKVEREDGRLRVCLVKKNKEDEDEDENVDGEGDIKGCDEGDLKKGCLWGGEWSSSRCNGDENGSKRLPSLPYCVAIS